MSNSLDPDQAEHFVRPDLDPYCLQSLSADDKIHHERKMLIPGTHKLFSIYNEAQDHTKQGYILIEKLVFNSI